MKKKDWYKVEIRELIRKNLGKIHRKVGDSYGIDVSYLHKMISDYATQELSKAREEGGESIIAQLSLSENMEKVERFFREAPIDYDDKCNLWFDFLSKLTTK